MLGIQLLAEARSFASKINKMKQKHMTLYFITLCINVDVMGCEYFKHDTESLNIIREYSQNSNCILVNRTNLDDSVFNLLLRMKVPMVISNGLTISEHRATETSICPNLIVQLDSIENLAPIFNQYAKRRGFLFILLNDKLDWYKIWQHSSYYWSKYKIYKVFYITVQSSKFYHPFVDQNNNYGVLVETKNANFKTIFKNLNGYPLKVIIFDSGFSKVRKTALNYINIEGVDAEVALLLAKFLNFTMQLQWPVKNIFGARLENGSFDGVLGQLIRYETDLTMTGFFIKDYLTRNVQFSVAVYMDKLCCYVVKSKRIPESILPLYAVDRKVWTVYIIVGVFSSFVWSLLRATNLYIDKYAVKYNAVHKTFSYTALCVQYASVIADTWILWMRMIIVRFPPYNSERIFVISLCFVSVIIEALFASSLATIYINPRYYKDIETLKELERANIKIFIKHAAMRDDLFKGQNTRLYKNLDERLMLVGEPEERLISIMSKRGRFAAVTREYTLLTGDIYYIITKKIHIIPECPKTYHIAYLYTKNSPYEEPFNVALLQFLAAGLIDQWIDISKHKEQCQIRSSNEFVNENSNQWKAFQINDLQMAFLILMFGNICATFICVTEIFIKKKMFKL